MGLVFVLMLPGAVVGSQFRLMNKFFSASGRPILMTISQVGVLAFAIFAYPLSVISGGLIGVAVASSVVYILATVVSMFVFSRSYQSTPTIFDLRHVATDWQWAVEQLSQLIPPRFRKVYSGK